MKALSIKEVIPLIRSIDLFSPLEDADLEALAPFFFRKDVATGEEIFDQDDPSCEIFLILDGRVRIVRKGEDGKEATLAVLRRGDFFGEISIFTGEPRSAAARAVEDTGLLVLQREHFLQAINTAPRISLAIITELSRRLLEADRTIASLLWDNAYRKIVLALKRLAQTEGVPRGDALVVKHRVTHQEMADMAGTSRETASRILAFLKKAGAAVPSGRNIIIREAAIPPSFAP